MEIVTPQPNIIERFNRWLQDSIMIKLMSIGFLVLVLLIPSSWIDNIIEERQSRAESVMAEVSDKWSGQQSITGPVLVIPYIRQQIIDRGKDGKEIIEHNEKAFFLPKTLNVNGTIDPEVLHRGIFDAVVYKSSLDITSSFETPDFKSLSINETSVIWKDAYMVLGISDVRGITDNLLFSVNGKPIEAEQSSNIGVLATKAIKATSTDYQQPQSYSAALSNRNGVLVKLNATGPLDLIGSVHIKLSLKGSQRLDFVPVGKTTTVNLKGPWADPSFDGEFLPTSRQISETGFAANWKILHFNRPFSQQWKEDEQELSGADFGIKLILPVDQYQKSMRTSKYSVLIILLTFIALFLVEITQKIRIHPFQYILIGAALTIYYVLLLSISEQTGYNIAYGLASASTVILITLYSVSFLRNTRLTLLFCFLLVVFYTFIFVIILQQDFSLLLGSIGLFIIVAMLMYFSRSVNWYHQGEAR
ncbi:MAG: cell envelope integrity protein CreD [Chryseolinea sp.]